MSEDLRKVTCALTPAQSFKDTHSNTRSQGEKEHAIGKYTGAHASRHTHPRPGGTVASQAQFVRMERRHIMYSSQQPPTPKRGVGNIICKACPFG